jgi:hypothetical protein
VLVSIGLLALVATQIDFGGVHSRLSGGRWWLFALGVCALFVSFVVGAVRWHVFLRAAGVESTRRQATSAYLIGAFTSNFLPTQVGGDVTRALFVAERGQRIRSATTVVVDRASALACLIAVGWLLVAVNPGPVPGQLLAALAAASAAFVVVCVLIALLARVRRLRRFVPPRARSAAGQVHAALAGCLTRPVLWRTFVVGLGFEGLVCLAAWLVARSISVSAPLAVLGAALAPVFILAVAPVSIGGYGVREGSFVLLLGYADVGATDASLFSLLLAAAFAIASLPGGFALIRRVPPVSRSALSPEPRDGHDRDTRSVGPVSTPPRSGSQPDRP